MPRHESDRLSDGDGDVGSPLYCEATGTHLSRMAPLVATRLLKLEGQRSEAAELRPGKGAGRAKLLGMRRNKPGGGGLLQVVKKARELNDGPSVGPESAADDAPDRGQYARLLGQLGFDVQVVSRNPDRSPLVCVNEAQCGCFA